MEQWEGFMAIKEPTDGGVQSPRVASLEPITVRLPEASRISGFSRSEIYRRAGQGEIVLLKCRARTLVDVGSLRRAVASLPRAAIRPAVRSGST